MQRLQQPSQEIPYSWAAGALILAFLLVLFVQRRYISPLHDIPGPFVASFSDLWQVWIKLKGRVGPVTIKLHGEHGKFVRIAPNEISICDPEGAQDVLKSHMNKGDFYKVLSLPDYKYVNQMSETDYDRHIVKNKNIAPGFTLSNVLKSEPYIDKLLTLFRQRLDELSVSRKPVHFDLWFTYLAFDVIGEVVFSKQFGFISEGQDIDKAISIHNSLVLYLSVIGHFRWVHEYFVANPLFEYLHLQPAMFILKTTKKAIDARCKSDTVRNDMMEQWMDTRRKYPERMEEKEILIAAITTVGAGSDTTSTALQAFLYYILHNPKLMAQLREEIDKANLSPIPGYEETQKLKLLQACIKEAYRFHPSLGLHYSRVSPPDGITICGRYFPAGVELSVNPWAINRIVSVFGPDADTFNPYRWLADEEVVREMDRNMITFGAGYNACLGRNLAHLEISKTAALLLRDFDIKLVDERREWKTATHFAAYQWDWPCWIEPREGRL